MKYAYVLNRFELSLFVAVPALVTEPEVGVVREQVLFGEGSLAQVRKGEVLKWNNAK